MKKLKNEFSQETIEAVTAKESATESHSYNNPDDLIGMVEHEARIIMEVRGNPEVYSVDLSEENGNQYAIVTRKKDGQILLKTKNPVSLSELFPLKD